SYLSSLAASRLLHSFPTRRSSDLSLMGESSSGVDAALAVVRLRHENTLARARGAASVPFCRHGVRSGTHEGQGPSPTRLRKQEPSSHPLILQRRGPAPKGGRDAVRRIR